MPIANPSVVTFQELITNFYANKHRDLPWRQPEDDGSFDAYRILVSEVMLQQTQVSRVVSKYQEFLGLFPTVQALAEAELADVLKAWSGLGYNRRGKYLWQAAQLIVGKFFGQVPDNQSDLSSLPGVGPNTAGAILAYAFNQPVVFIETNIRTVMLQHFFVGQARVTDREILTQVAKTLEGQDSRTWYWALMDYGAHLKATQPRHLHRAKAHVRQSKFAGSDRQLRGRVIKHLTASSQSLEFLKQALDDPRDTRILKQLEDERLIHIDDGMVSLG